MRIAILSDIHGNLEALEAVLADASERGYDRLACLGDVVGYGADPQACVDRIREVVWSDPEGEWVVKGNHDEAASGGDDTYFNREAQKAVRWANGRLDAATVAWLDSLPLEKRFPPDVYFVHSSPNEPKNWNYVVSLGDAQDAFLKFTERLCFIGHSHVPFHVLLRGEGSDVEVEASDTVDLVEGIRCVSNVGSVGQPRDGDPRACYVLLDLEKNRLERFRVEYDIDEASRKIREAELPEFLADRLHRGR